LLDSQSSQGSQSDPSPRPRFEQIADEIRAQISRGVLGVHDMLPSERTLSEQFKVSRMTGRRALESLETEGLVYSADRRGRFVSPKRLTYNVSKVVSFVDTAQSNDIGFSIDLIETAAKTTDSRVAKLLEQPEDSPLVAYTRLFNTGAHPVFLETEYLVADRFPNILSHDLCQSTMRIHEECYGAPSITGDIVIRMRGAYADEAKHLGIGSSHAVIELEQVIRGEAGVPFSFGRQVWRGEMAEFSADAIATGQREDRG